MGAPVSAGPDCERGDDVWNVELEEVGPPSPGIGCRQVDEEDRCLPAKEKDSGNEENDSPNDSSRGPGPRLVLLEQGRQVGVGIVVARALRPAEVVANERKVLGTKAWVDIARGRRRYEEDITARNTLGKSR